MSETTETDQIERDLARTRARMDNRLDELQDRLSPGQLVNDAFAYFKGGDGADFTQDVLGKLKANPLPAALTGIGLAWLMVSNARTSQTPARVTREPDLATRLRTAEAGVMRQQDEHPDAYSGRIDDARGKVLGIARDASDTASTYGQRIKDAMASAAQSVRETAHDLSASASHGATRLSDNAQRGGVAVQEGMESMAQSTRETLASATSNPIVLGAIAAVVGMVAGSLIPTSDEEERALGATADKLRTAGRDLAQDVVDRGARVASEAIGAVKDSAQAHGLSGDRPIGEMVADLKSGALAGAVKEVAGEAVSAGRDSVHTHFSSGSDADISTSRTNV
ncbi:DUF3618 domain-containing protein [Sphingomonas solaris]|uniref:DUF3618 domain-containing protein n=1 Tax=Alterirhizorhabdus solaris TaxID=2529389 RepID=A0A558RAP8_9SPHN|nr:DUF3618 domain-containing protein [Sphingomonas solaris]TVV76466.1 DUF3618 domain-containing protein [Sphingomonas solaris]